MVVGTWLWKVGKWESENGVADVVGVGWDERKNPLSLSGMRERRWEVWFFPLVLYSYHKLAYTVVCLGYYFCEIFNPFFFNINSINTQFMHPMANRLQPHLHNQPLSHPLLTPHHPDPHREFSSPHALTTPPFHHHHHHHHLPPHFSPPTFPNPAFNAFPPLLSSPLLTTRPVPSPSSIFLITPPEDPVFEHEGISR